jgi:hypothetical protein
MSNCKDYIKFLLVQIFILIITNSLAHATGECTRDSIGSLRFEKSKVKLSNSNKRKLDSLLTIIRKQSECKILVVADSRVICHGDTRANKYKWNRIQTIIKYFEINGIQRGRIIFQFGTPQEDTIELYLDHVDVIQNNPLPPQPLHKVWK